MGRPGALNRLREAVAGFAEASLPDERSWCVAVSGGPDSVALAAAAAAVLPTTALIVDHGLQAGSEAVAATARAVALDLGCVSALVLPVRVGAAGGPEAAARTARYAALDSARDGAPVLLGHTLDDQAETVLLGLVRGSGTRSLAGMPRARGRYRRPMLDIPRSVVAAALAECDVGTWSDPHNSDPRFLRSRVRNTVLPVLEEQLGPGVAQALARTAELARDDADALDEWARQTGAELAGAGWPVARIAALPRAIRTRVLRGLALDSGAPATDLTSSHVADIDRLVTAWRGQGPLHLPGRVVLRRECGRLVVDG